MSGRAKGRQKKLLGMMLGPGYNPPRRRWCLYLSRGKPPSVCAYLSLPPSLSSRSSDPPRHVCPVPSHSQSTFWQLTLVPGGKGGLRRERVAEE
ncbi:hypothetical protein ALC53_01938 [Atta colombica]|uniref:Uncharacterized protein n=1 Tax=Atta colombica TaxID=520822 RepID=A0A195BT67_9HYME|nr:hypothetical protein ALC53_01938 [Atta colombica]